MMPRSSREEEVSNSMTELTLGLPGENPSPSTPKSSSKRGFSQTLDLNLGVGGPCWNGKQVQNDEEDHADHMSQSSAPKPPPPKAQLVGWPPVRVSRKKSCKYVKVAVDGAPYLRKVDLQLYHTYHQLLKALEDMFSCYTIRNFFNGGKLILDPVNVSEYVPTYEDKDGDWMMVGDVPWKMFVESCKRIRLMKSSDAIQLGRYTSKVEQMKEMRKTTPATVSCQLAGAVSVLPYVQKKRERKTKSSSHI